MPASHHRVAHRLLPRLTGGDAARTPGDHLGVDVTGRGEHGRAAAQVHDRLPDAGVEPGEVGADIRFASELIERVLEDGVLLAQLGRRRSDTADVLGIELLLDPPVGILGLWRPRAHAAHAGQVVEVAALDRAVEGGFDDLGAIGE